MLAMVFSIAWASISNRPSKFAADPSTLMSGASNDSVSVVPPPAGANSNTQRFVVAASHIPGAYEEFSRFVVPELQRRGVFHNDYRGTTLRENLGLDRPRIGA